MAKVSETLILNTEALIFASETSISIDDIRLSLQAALEKEIGAGDILAAVAQIKEKYAGPNMAISLEELSGGYQFLTKKEYHPVVNQLLAHRSKKKLSQAAMETLAIIAYRQPITKLEIEQIRGVNCDYTVQRLLEKELISIAGKDDTVGRPLLYVTSSLFMDYFGINSVAELPQLKDISSQENKIGDTAE